MKIAGSVAVITGGASGLGRATAERLLAGGGKVALLDLPKSAGVDVAKQMGGNTLFAACDVTSADEVAAALEAAVVKLGAVHVLVNWPASARRRRPTASVARPISASSRGSSRST